MIVPEVLPKNLSPSLLNIQPLGSCRLRSPKNSEIKQLYLKPGSYNEDKIGNPEADVVEDPSDRGSVPLEFHPGSER